MDRFASLKAQAGCFAAAAFGLLFLSQLLGLPFTDVGFVGAVVCFACCNSKQDADAKRDTLPGLRSPKERSVEMGSFFDYLWKHHQLLNLIWGEQKGKRTQGLALGVGAVVMLLWKLFSAKSEPASSLIWRLLDIQRLKGWAYTLAASKFIKFITKQTAELLLRVSQGLAWMKIKDIGGVFAAIIFVLLFAYVPFGSWFSVLFAFLKQWLFAITVMDTCFVYIRWQLWICVDGFAYMCKGGRKMVKIGSGASL